MDSWPLWEEKIIVYSKVEAQNRRVIKDILYKLEAKDDEIVNDSG